MKRLFTITCALCAAMTTSGQQSNMLYYNTPAEHWTEALPIGNSHIGAMVFGKTDTETIQLNDETFWAGSPHSNNSEKAYPHLAEIQQLIKDGKTEEAQNIVNENFFTGQNGMSYLTLGNILIDYDNKQEAFGYDRILRLFDAVATTKFTKGNTHYVQDTYVSFNSDVLVNNISISNNIKDLAFTVDYNCPLQNEVTVKGNQMIIKVKGKDQEGVQGKLEAVMIVDIQTDGKVSEKNNRLRVLDASFATMRVASATNFVNYQNVSGNAMQKAQAAMDNALKTSVVDDIRKHSEIYTKQYNRVSLNLPTNQKLIQTSDQRVKNFKTQEDPALIALMFNYGRYLLICSSQPGGQPANLQGIWNNSPDPAWDSKYTININAEMNYWPAEVTNLSDFEKNL